MNTGPFLVQSTGSWADPTPMKPVQRFRICWIINACEPGRFCSRTQIEKIREDAWPSARAWQASYCSVTELPWVAYAMVWNRPVFMDMKVKVIQSCPTLCDPTDYTACGILQARILEWVAFPFSRHLPNPGIKARSPALQVDSLPAEPPGKPFHGYI